MNSFMDVSTAHNNYNVQGTDKICPDLPAGSLSVCLLVNNNAVSCMIRTKDELKLDML